MAAIADPLDRIADKARVLTAAGYSRADIARFLDRSYQQVRQILEQDEARRRRQTTLAVRAGPGVAEGPPSAFARTDLPVRLVARPDGALLLPPELGATPGEVFMARRTEHGFEVIDAQTSLKRAQDLVRPFIEDERSLVDEMIAERRLEAAREWEEAQQTRPKRD